MIAGPFIARLTRNRGGMAVPEFALVLVPLLLMLMGGMEFGYQAYVRSVTLGALETLTRMITIENASSTDAETALRTQIKQVAPKAIITVTRGSFDAFGSIDTLEPLTLDLNGNGVLDGPVDTDGNGVTDASDCWKDVDNDGTRNRVTLGKDGIGGADDIVRYTIAVSYQRLLPIGKLLNISNTANVGASTLVRRQPYESQATPVIRCAG